MYNLLFLRTQVVKELKASFVLLLIRKYISSYSHKFCKMPGIGAGLTKRNIIRWWSSTSLSENSIINDEKLNTESVSLFESKKLEIYASTRKWNFVITIIKKYFDSGKILVWSSKCSECCRVQHNTLHCILQYNPPVHVVRKIVETVPNSVNEADCMNRYPIHVALLYGTTPNVLNFLLSLNRKALISIDKEGKTPMHLAVDGYELLNADLSSRFSSFENFSEVVDILHSIDPSFVTRKDFNEKNAVKYALHKKVDKLVVSKLSSLKERRKSV